MEKLLNVINCLPGQVTVLRGHSLGELEPYQRALAGLSGKERFRITFGEKEYKPGKHILIGFGEKFTNPKQKLREYFHELGLPSTTIGSSLVAYGLNEALDKTFDQLSECQLRRIQIYTATLLDNNLVIFHNPLEPISMKWKERFAELIVRFARNRKAVVLISSLSYRPQSWIGNEEINRVQVGANTKRTIGFSGDASQMQSMIKEVRRQSQAIDLNATAKKAKAAAPIASTSQIAKEASSVRAKVETEKKKVSNNKRSKSKKSSSKNRSNRKKVPKSVRNFLDIVENYPYLALGSSVAACILLLVFGSFLFSSTPIQEKPILAPKIKASGQGQGQGQGILNKNLNDNQEPKIASKSDLATKKITTNSMTTQTVNSKISDSSKTLQVIAQPKPKMTSSVKLNPTTRKSLSNASLIVSDYSMPIRKSILDTFSMDPNDFNPDEVSKSKSAKAKRQEFGVSLLKSLEKANDTAKGEYIRSNKGNRSSPSIHSDMSLEERRAMLREKFRQAIERAAANK